MPNNPTLPSVDEVIQSMRQADLALVRHELSVMLKTTNEFPGGETEFFYKRFARIFAVCKKP